MAPVFLAFYLASDAVAGCQMSLTSVTPSSPEQILRLRDEYREEMSCQIIHYSWLARGWYDAYSIELNREQAGYGCVGGIRGRNRVNAMEFYVQAQHRGIADRLFSAFIRASGARRIECQTNDVLLTLMMYDTASRIRQGPILFRDSAPTNHRPPGARFRRLMESDLEKDFPEDLHSDAEWVIEWEGRIVATGGVLTHYNPPYGDIYMAVSGPYRRRGFGSYLVQELKSTCYDSGKIPAARCNAANTASRATLQRAGFIPCGRLLAGTIKPEFRS